MKLNDLKKEVQQYQYMEDTNIINVALASVIATRLKIGSPIWLVVIGASSGGKSQILRPIALTDKKFLHRLDDVTENTFLSGTKSKEGEMSLLKKLGVLGMLVISDLTVLFSKSSESRATILSQFRMIFDGEMVKHVGNNPEPIKWEGHLGILAGSTPSIYAVFEEVSDMGERFIYYRMKEYDARKATHLALSRTSTGKDLDDKLSELYADYIKEAVVNFTESPKELELSDEIKDRIIEVSAFAERVRTSVHTDFKGEKITRIPVPAMPMRVALQLMTIAQGMLVMSHLEGNNDLSENDLSIIDWCGYSLANEEKRACLRVLASVEYGVAEMTGIIADKIGLDTNIVGLILQNLSAVGVVTRSNTGGGLIWNITRREDWEIVRRIEGIVDIDTEDRERYDFDD